MQKNKPSGYQGDSNLLFNLCRGNISCSVKVLFSLLLLSLDTKTALAECPLPKGSYQDTCTATGTEYVSPDNYLHFMDVCRFDLYCKTLKGERLHTFFYVPTPILDEDTALGNRNGVPFIEN